MITPRLMPLDFHVESFSKGPLEGKLMDFDVINLTSLKMKLLGALRLNWENLRTEIFLKGNIPSFVV